ncbi:MAG: hypothetical protein KKD97_07930 [Gammaproteobacteria bacterium]|nr:hypothetical protein [Gammaproteobacteria bacterium]
MNHAQPPLRRTTMARFDRPLSAALLSCLLGTTSAGAHARELATMEPLRVTLVSLARQASSSPSAPGTKLSVRRAWATDSVAQLCALTLDAQGRPVLDRGRFQLQRIQFQRQKGQWRVQRSDTSWLPAGGSLDAACPKTSDPMTSPTQLAKASPTDINLALAEMERHPPTAGLPGSLRDQRAEASCTLKPMQPVEPTDLSQWRVGRIEAEGRTHLFTAPDQACPLGKHLVQNDKIRIGPTQGAWTQVQYTHPITQVITFGWLPSQRAIAIDTQVAGSAR